MGRAQERWEQLRSAWESNDFDAIEELYTQEALYLEPYNPPHNGNLLITAYLKDFLGNKQELKITVKRILEDDSLARVAVEWAMSYTAAGRRWNNLPRASFIEVDHRGLIVYHRDYT